MQGDLDGLCGVYSLLNAVQWALHTCTEPARGRRQPPKLLIGAEQQALFDTLVTALGKRRPLATFVTGGINSVELTRLLRVSREWLFDHRKADLVFRRPFYRQRTIATRRVLGLREHLAPGSAAIIAVEWTLPDSTLATGLSRKRIRLSDSGYGVS